jgi:alkylhydroperoxidase family enzyme
VGGSSTPAVDPRASLAPEVLESLAEACAAARSATDPSLLELARLRLATILDNESESGARPWGSLEPAKREALASWPTSELFDERERAALALTEQFAIDVGGVVAGPLGPSAGVLGADVGPFVQALYVLDVGQRAAKGLAALFDVPLSSSDWAWPAVDAVSGTDQMAAMMRLLGAIGRLQTLDPVLKELVRLRGARLHRCRRCQSVRSVAALNAGADEGLLSSAAPEEIADLPAATLAALDLVDALFGGPATLDDELVARLRDSFGPSELVELVSYLMRNAANKIPVAFGVDDAIVESGFELQIIDADGETLTVDDSALTTR